MTLRRLDICSVGITIERAVGWGCQQTNNLVLALSQFKEAFTLRQLIYLLCFSPMSIRFTRTVEGIMYYCNIHVAID